MANANGKITWTNERRKLSDLIPWPRNPRQIKTDQAKRLVESFDQFGQVETIAIGPDGDIYNGHQRLNVLAEKYGKDYEIEVRVSDRTLSEKEREKLTIFLHKGAAGEWDFDTLANEFELDDLLEWGFDRKELDLDLWAGPVQDDPGAQMDKAEELREKWGVQSGQLWKLGEHRLICGDCTDRAVVERVMQGEKAQLLFTSPPYWVGMAYEYQKNVEEIKKFINDVTLAFIPFMSTDNSRIIINTGTGRATAPTLEVNYDPETWLLLDWWRDALYSYDWKLRHIRIWIKQGGFPMPRSPMTDIVDQHWEFIATFYNPNGKKRGQNRVDSSWAQQGYWDDIPGEARQSGHIAAFPVELPSRNIELYAEKDEVILEPFSGSGTTLIACERLGRKCRAVEISPAYCAVAIQRWVDMTGGIPKLVE